MGTWLLFEKKNQKNDKKNRRNRLFDAKNFWLYFCNLAKKYG
jgi:hypothetical protein